MFNELNRKIAELVAGEESARSAYKLHEACFDKATDISIFLARASAALRYAKSWKS